MKSNGFEINIKDLVNFVQVIAEKQGFTFQEACWVLKDAYGLKCTFRTLTRRERDIAILAAWGASVNETAEKLFIAPNTVQSYRYRIRRKLEIPAGTHLNIHLVRVFYESET